MGDPMQEEERRRCCISGGCGCSGLRARKRALAEQLAAWGNYEDAADALLREYVLLPRTMLTPMASDEPFEGGAA
jgi:hypothetical protein